MVIDKQNLKKSLGIIVFMFFSSDIFSEDLNKIDHSDIQKSLPSSGSKNNSNDMFVWDFEILYDSIYIKDQGKFHLSAKPGTKKRPDLNSKSTVFSLKENEYLLLRGLDKREKLFNGTIIIKFKRLPDLNQYAVDNDMAFEGDLASISRGIYRVTNIFDVQAKINELKKNSNVERIDLETIDPSVSVR